MQNNTNYSCLTIWKMLCVDTIFKMAAVVGLLLLQIGLFAQNKWCSMGENAFHMVFQERWVFSHSSPNPAFAATRLWAGYGELVGENSISPGKSCEMHIVRPVRNSYLVLPGWGHILTLVTQTHQDRFIPAHVFAAIHVHFNPSNDLFPTMRNAMEKAWSYPFARQGTWLSGSLWSFCMCAERVLGWVFADWQTPQVNFAPPWFEAICESSICFDILTSPQCAHTYPMPSWT